MAGMVDSGSFRTDTGGAPFELRRLGVVMEPEPGNSYEEEGVLNPAVVRGRDGQLYLFPRLVARGNYSRIGIARVRFGEDGDPVGSGLPWSRKPNTSCGKMVAAVKTRASALSTRWGCML